MTDDLETYKELFKLFDKNNDGFISYGEYIAILKIYNKDMSIDNTFFDFSTHIQMSFDDFLHRIQNETIEKIEEHEIIKAFEIFDIDGDGLISTHDYKIIMTKLGDNLTAEIIEETFSELGLDPREKITYDIFKKIVLSFF